MSRWIEGQMFYTRILCELGNGGDVEEDWMGQIERSLRVGQLEFCSSNLDEWGSNTGRLRSWWSPFPG